jgi:hypothetical protein
MYLSMLLDIISGRGEIVGDALSELAEAHIVKSLRDGQRKMMLLPIRTDLTPYQFSMVLHECYRANFSGPMKFTLPSENIQIVTENAINMPYIFEQEYARNIAIKTHKIDVPLRPHQKIEEEKPLEGNPPF